MSNNVFSFDANRNFRHFTLVDADQASEEFQIQVILSGRGTVDTCDKSLRACDQTTGHSREFLIQSNSNSEEAGF